MPISVKAQFERNRLDRAKKHSGHLMVSVAGESKDFVRTPVSTILLLDVSGSMAELCQNPTQIVINTPPPIVINPCPCPPPQPSPWGQGSPWIKSWNPWDHEITCSSYEPASFKSCSEPQKYDYVYSQPSYYTQPKTKIEALKETAKKIVGHLTGSDQVAIVTFSYFANVVAPLQSGNNKQALYDAITRLRADGSTNLSGGLLQALQMVNSEFVGVKRILLLTDGRPTTGSTDSHSLVNYVRTREKACTLSTFGFGMDCDHQLLSDMAKAGGGNKYFINSADDLNETFAVELGGVLSCVGQNIKVKVVPNKGIKVDSILNSYSISQDNDVTTINAEDVYAGETKHILVKLDLDVVKKPKPRPVSVSHVEVSYDDLKTGKRETLTLNPKIEYVKASKADDRPVLAVAEQVAILETARLHRKAVEAANTGDFKTASLFMYDANSKLKGAADIGSVLCCSAMDINEDMTKNFTADTFTASYGATVDSDSQSLMKTRGNIGALSKAAYSTDAMKKMAEDFKSAIDKEETK